MYNMENSLLKRRNLHACLRKNGTPADNQCQLYYLCKRYAPPRPYSVQADITMGKNSATPEPGICTFMYYPHLPKRTKKAAWKKWKSPHFFHAIPCCTAGMLHISAGILKSLSPPFGQTARKSSAASPCSLICSYVK